MEIEDIKLTDIIPSDYNPRKISDADAKKLSRSLEEFGLVDPIIINLKNYHIIGGHQRFNTLLDNYFDTNEDDTYQLLKLGDIGYVFKDTELTVKDSNHEKALNLALNKISGEWDLPKLEPLLEDLSLTGLDLDLTGFDETDLEELNFNMDSKVETSNDNTESEYIEPEEIDVNVSLGDKYQLGNHFLMCGDSSIKDNIDKLVDNADLDLLLTDPPYGINIVNSNNTVGTTSKVGFKDTGTVGVKGVVKARKYKSVLNDDKSYNPQILLDLNIPSIIFGANNFSSKLPDSPKWLVWYKKPIDSPDNNFSDVELAWTNIDGKVCKLYHYLWSGLLREGNRDVELKERVHPTQKPVGLLQSMITDYTKESDNVLDLFGGSGSTLIACEQTNRNCYMMELDPYYCQVIINRWETLTGETATQIN